MEVMTERKNNVREYQESKWDEWAPWWGNHVNEFGDYLKVVDPWADDIMAAIFDGGCNKSCTSIGYVNNSEGKLRKHGYQHVWVHRDEKNYSGIGKSKTEMLYRLLANSRWLVDDG